MKAFSRINSGDTFVLQGGYKIVDGNSGTESKAESEELRYQILWNGGMQIFAVGLAALALTMT